MISPALQQDVDVVGGIEAVPHILEVICRSTGMGFAAVARVTESHWVCCSVRDEIAFGLKPGGELKVETTICDGIRASARSVVIDDATVDPVFCGHPTPAMYGFKSYISVPILRGDGAVWGTLCALDPEPARLKTPQVAGMFELFSQLIAFHLDAQERLRASESALLDATQTSRLREQFIAVLGHDLRNPLQTLKMGAAVLGKAPERAGAMLPLMQKSIGRMSELIDNLMDFARGRLGSGLVLRRTEEDLAGELRQVVDEMAAAWPERAVVYQADLSVSVSCDRARIAQLLSNLLGNAMKYGDPDQPVRVTAHSDANSFELSVANGGRPIPAEVKSRLFEPYFRGSAPTTQEGLGLGLYIVSEIARAHGGTVDVASDAGETRFTFRMPQAAALKS